MSPLQLNPVLMPVTYVAEYTTMIKSKTNKQFCITFCYISFKHFVVKSKYMKISLLKLLKTIKIITFKTLVFLNFIFNLLMLHLRTLKF